MTPFGQRMAEGFKLPNRDHPMAKTPVENGEYRLECFGFERPHPKADMTLGCLAWVSPDDRIVVTPRSWVYSHFDLQVDGDIIGEKGFPSVPHALEAAITYMEADVTLLALGDDDE